MIKEPLSIFILSSNLIHLSSFLSITLLCITAYSLTLQSCNSLTEITNVCHFCCVYSNMIYKFAGSPARTVGWRDPGFIHTGFLKELWPNSVYVTSWNPYLCQLFRNTLTFLWDSLIHLRLFITGS